MIPVALPYFWWENKVTFQQKQKKNCLPAAAHVFWSQFFASFSNLCEVFWFGDAHKPGKSAGSTGPPSSTRGGRLIGRRSCEAYHSCSAAAPLDSASKYFNSSPAALITTSKSEDSQLGWTTGLPLMWGGLACRTELWLSPKKQRDVQYHHWCNSYGF